MNYNKPLDAHESQQYFAWLKSSENEWLASLDKMDPVARALHFCRVRFLILSASKKHGEIWRENVERWYSHLKDVMLRHNLKKSDLSAHGLSWGACVKLYHAAVG